MNYKPLVSIVIPVYNGSNYMKDAIDSALAQTYKNLEIIVVNDGSKDDGATRDIALSYGDKIRYIEKENGGVSSALNTGIRAMKGEWFSWLSHDDMYEPTKIEKQIEILNKKGKTHNDKVVLHCSGKQINADGESIVSRNTNVTKDFAGLDMFVYNRKVIADPNGLAMLVPKKAFEEVGYFDENLIFIQDIKVWDSLMFHEYEFICHDDKLVISRVHNKQVTVLKSEANIVERNLYAEEMYEKYYSKNVEKYKKCMVYFYYWAIMVGFTDIAKSYKQKMKDLGVYTMAVKIKGYYYTSKGKIYNFARNIYKNLIQRRK